MEQSSRAAGTRGARGRRLPDSRKEKEVAVDNDRIKGMADQAKGKVKEWVGKATGDTKTHAEGKMDQIKGKAENAVGGVKDAIRDKNEHHD
jgi:uncharacterized protein YjbJ (UPF0337 family)